MRKEQRPVRGVFEKVPGSGVWWIRFTDAEGVYRREKCGTFSTAKKLLATRQSDALKGIKLPQLRRRVVTFGELCDDASAYATKNNAGHVSDNYRIARLKTQFGKRAAEGIKIAELRDFFDSQCVKGSTEAWSDGTFNRMRSVLLSVYRLGIENEKITLNVAAKLEAKDEPDGRVRYLNEFEPEPGNDNEETRLRKVIAADYGDTSAMEQLDIALNTGLRLREQFMYIEWKDVNLKMSTLFVPQSKTSKSRNVPLNSAARNAFTRLWERRGESPYIFPAKGGVRLQSPRHWFEDAIVKAAIPDFSWHCLRHTFASRLVMKGTDIATVSRLMGHGGKKGNDLRMTMKYVHLSPGHLQSSVAKLDENSYNSFSRVESGSNEVPQPSSTSVAPDANFENANHETIQ